MRWFQTDQCRHGLRSLQPVAVADQTFLHIATTLQTTKVLSLLVITVEQIRNRHRNRVPYRLRVPISETVTVTATVTETVTVSDTDTVTGNRKPETDSVAVIENRNREP